MLDKRLAGIKSGIARHFDHLGTDPRDFAQTKIVDFVRCHIGGGKTARPIGVVFGPVGRGENARRARPAIGLILVFVKAQKCTIGRDDPRLQSELCLTLQACPICVVYGARLFCRKRLPHG